MKSKKLIFEKIAVALLISFAVLSVIVSAEECVGEQCSINATIGVIEPPEEVEPQYLSSPIYQSLTGAGAGLSVFTNSIAQPLFVLLIGVLIAGIFIGIVFTISKVIKNNLKAKK